MILCRFRVIANYLSKAANFNQRHLIFGARIPFEFLRDVWRQKTSPWAILRHYLRLRHPMFSRFYRATAMLSAVYAVVVLCVCVCLSHSGIVSKRLQYRSVTDTQTDTHTVRHMTTAYATLA